MGRRSFTTTPCPVRAITCHVADGCDHRIAVHGGHRGRWSRYDPRDRTYQRAGSKRRLDGSVAHGVLPFASRSPRVRRIWAVGTVCPTYRVSCIHAVREDGSRRDDHRQDTAHVGRGCADRFSGIRNRQQLRRRERGCQGLSRRAGPPLLHGLVGGSHRGPACASGPGRLATPRGDRDPRPDWPRC